MRCIVAANTEGWLVGGGAEAPGNNRENTIRRSAVLPGE